MALEVFRVSEVGTRMYRTAPKVSILAGGICNFNVAAARKYLFTKGKRVKLYYDSKERVIGFELVNDVKGNNVKVTGNNQINLNRFIYYYKLKIKELIGSYDFEEHGALYVIDLKKRKPLMRINRSGLY